MCPPSSVSQSVSQSFQFEERAIGGQAGRLSDPTDVVIHGVKQTYGVVPAKFNFHIAL